MCKLQIKTCCTSSTCCAVSAQAVCGMNENYSSQIPPLCIASPGQSSFTPLSLLPQFHQFEKCLHCLFRILLMYFYKITRVDAQIPRKPGQRSGLWGECMWHPPHPRIHSLLEYTTHPGQLISACPMLLSSLLGFVVYTSFYL